MHRERKGQRDLGEAWLSPKLGRNVRLERIAKAFDWGRIEALVAGMHAARTGRPGWTPLLMVKSLLLQQWYGLSDPGLEEALGDRLSFRRFVGLDLDEGAPDHWFTDDFFDDRSRCPTDFWTMLMLAKRSAAAPRDKRFGLCFPLARELRRRL